MAKSWQSQRNGRSEARSTSEKVCLFVDNSEGMKPRRRSKSPLRSKSKPGHTHTKRQVIAVVVDLPSRAHASRVHACTRARTRDMRAPPRPRHVFTYLHTGTHPRRGVCVHTGVRTCARMDVGAQCAPVYACVRASRAYAHTRVCMCAHTRARVRAHHHRWCACMCMHHRHQRWCVVVCSAHHCACVQQRRLLHMIRISG